MKEIFIFFKLTNNVRLAKRKAIDINGLNQNGFKE